MKSTVLSGIVSILILFSCEKADNEVFFRTGGGLKFSFSDIELYDTSTHVMYFKEEHDEFKDIEGGSFTFFNNGDPIYTGSFCPEYSSMSPSGPFIMSPSLYGNHALKLKTGHSDKPDIRNDPRIISALNQHNLLHSGLSISASSVEI